MLKCAEVSRLQSEALDRHLSLGDRINLRAHTLMCDSCRRFGEQMDLLREFSRGFMKRDVPPEQENE